MTRRDFVKATAGGTLMANAMINERLQAAEAKKRKSPNLLFIFPDQWRRQAIGIMHEDPVVTPNLDRFAKEGIVFTQACSNTPVCSPYRAMLMTGKYPFSNGVFHNCHSGTYQDGNYLKKSERCFSDILHDAGYFAGYIGKWHLDAPQPPHWGPVRWDGNVWDDMTPPDSRHHFDFWYSYNCCDEHLHPHYWTKDTPWDKPIESDIWSPRHETDVAIDFIKNRDREKPFALFVAMNPPHPHFDLVPPEYLKAYGSSNYVDLLNRPNVDLSLGTRETDNCPTRAAKTHVKNYFAAITGIDEQFGRILKCLKEQGLEDNTIVVFTSDHGEMMGSHDRLQKFIYYEESIGVPFIIRWPQRIHSGKESLLFGAPDVMPTLLGLMGLEDMIPDSVEGTDYSMALLGGRMNPPESIPYLWPGQRGVRTDRYTFIIDRSEKDERIILFDNVKDKYQMTNIASEEPEVVSALRKMTYDWVNRIQNDPWKTT